MPDVPATIPRRRVSGSSASNDNEPSSKEPSISNDRNVTLSQSSTSLEDNKTAGDEKAPVHQEMEQDDVNTQDVSGSQEAPGTTDESEYISGMKRYSLMASLVLCFFLIMLDIAIVSTVCSQQRSW